MTGEEIYKYITESDSFDSEYRSSLLTYHGHLVAFGQKKDFFELLKKAFDLGKIIDIKDNIKNSDILFNEITFDMLDIV